MNNLYEVLEVCLHEIEQGTDIDSVLFRYPDLADELRPILEASLNARHMAVPGPSADVVRRNRARVLQRAAQLREAQVKPSRRFWFASIRRAAVTLVVIAALFVSGTNLVRAASTTLPGDDLYPVKRTWEDVLLLFTFNLQQREALEVEHENERLHELRELFAAGRAADVDFAGWVTGQNGNDWVVSGVRVVLSEQTEVRDGPIAVGSAVRVRGQTQGDGVVWAERVSLLPSDAKLPDIDIEDEHESGEDEPGDEQKQQEDNSGKGSEEEALASEDSDQSDSESGSTIEPSDDKSSDDHSGSGSGDQSDTSDDSTDDQHDDNSGSGGGNEDSGSEDSGGEDYSESGGGDD